MKREVLAFLLKAVVAACLIFGVFVCFFLVPWMVRYIARDIPALAEAAGYVYAYTGAVALPVVLALGVAWRVFDAIGKEQSFTAENARRMRLASWLALAEFFVFAAGLGLSFPLSLSHPFVLLCFLIACLFCGAASVVCHVIAQLVRQAALFKQENDLTI